MDQKNQKGAKGKDSRMLAPDSMGPGANGAARNWVQREFLSWKQPNDIYLQVKYKLVLSILFGCIWTGLSIYVSYPWIRELAKVVPPFVSWLIVSGLAFVPGIANAIILSGLIFDKRPQYYPPTELPPVSVLIAAYNEEQTIKNTLTSVLDQNYPGIVEVIVINDGSRDKTKEYIETAVRENNSKNVSIRPIHFEQNSGKATALNAGLDVSSHDLIVTLDADSYLFRTSLRNIVTYMINSPPDTAAVAGAVLTRNSRTNWMTKLQEWDYFHGIAVVKRIQSLYQGTLVAQGAYSVFRKHVLMECGGWKDTMGEDIVLTWALHSRKYRVRYAESAIVFTNVPESYKKFYQQRRRWARGLIEAFKQHPDVIFKMRMNTPFIWYNVLFPYLDFVFLFIFVPGLLAALFFHYYLIVGIVTLLLLPLALAMNALMFYKQKQIFKAMGLKVRRNILGFVVYMLVYQLIMTPASLMGYLGEALNLRKSWGTK